MEKLKSFIEQVRLEHANNQCSIDGCTKLAEICRIAKETQRLAECFEELVEALKDLLEYGESSDADREEGFDAILNARAALARAEAL